MTPRQFQLLAERSAELVKADDFRAGQVAAAVFNAGGMKRRGSRRPWRAADFFPSVARRDDGGSTAQIAAGMRTWIATMRATRKRGES